MINYCISTKYNFPTQGVGSAVNKLNDVIAMVAEVRSIAESLSMTADKQTTSKERSLKM